MAAKWTPKERLLAAFRREIPDRIPNFEFFFNHPGVFEHFMGRPYRDPADNIEFAQKIGWGSFSAAWLGWTPACKTSTASDGSEHYAGGVDLSRDDLKRLNPPPMDERLREIERLSSLVKGTGVGIHIFVTSCFHAIATSMGLENFALKCYDDPSLVEAWFVKIEQWNQHILKLALPLGVDFVIFDGDCAFKTGLMVSPEMFERLWYGPTRQTVEVIRSFEVPYLFHSDGKVDELYPFLIRLGFSAAHGVEAAANDLGEVKRRFGRDICLVGNMDQVILARGTPAIVKEETKKMLSEGAPGGGYVAACNTIVSECIPLENYLTMLRTIEEYGRYAPDGSLVI